MVAINACIFGVVTLLGLLLFIYTYLNRINRVPIKNNRTERSFCEGGQYEHEINEALC